MKDLLKNEDTEKQVEGNSAVEKLRKKMKPYVLQKSHLTLSIP